MTSTLPYTWRVRTRLPHRFGQACRVLIRGGMNSCLVEFADGQRHVTSRNYLRKQNSQAIVSSPRPSSEAAGDSDNLPSTPVPAENAAPGLVSSLLTPPVPPTPAEFIQTTTAAPDARQNRKD